MTIFMDTKCMYAFEHFLRFMCMVKVTFYPYYERSEKIYINLKKSVLCNLPLIIEFKLY